MILEIIYNNDEIIKCLCSSLNCEGQCLSIRNPIWEAGASSHLVNLDFENIKEFKIYKATDIEKEKYFKILHDVRRNHKIKF